jgi:hypothetical protein
VSCFDGEAADTFGSSRIAGDALSIMPTGARPGLLSAADFGHEIIRTMWI